MHNSSEVHISAVMRIMHYLKSTYVKGLMFSRHGQFEIATDFDWGAKGFDEHPLMGILPL